jgi:uncharacterized protein (TIGR02611 family)
MPNNQPTQPDGTAWNRDSPSKIDEARYRDGEPAGSAVPADPEPSSGPTPQRADPEPSSGPTPQRADAEPADPEPDGSELGPGGGAPTRRPGLRARARLVRARIRRLPGGRAALKIIVAATGAAFVALGLLLVPLPGPGWAIVFGGLAIWAVEFAWAQNLLDWVRRQVRTWTRWVRRQPWPVRVLLGLAVVGVLAGAVWLWFWQDSRFATLSQFWDFLWRW